MMNAGHLYYGTLTGTLLEAVRKYQARGFRYVRCKDVHAQRQTCKVSSHTLTDSGMMWMNMVAVPESSHSCLEIFRQFGVLDIQWMLGGMPCGLEYAFCRPRVEVVNEDS